MQWRSFFTFFLISIIVFFLCVTFTSPKVLLTHLRIFHYLSYVFFLIKTCSWYYFACQYFQWKGVFWIYVSFPYYLLTHVQQAEILFDTTLEMQAAAAEPYSEPCQTSKMKRFTKILAKFSILDIWKSFECASDQCRDLTH